MSDPVSKSDILSKEEFLEGISALYTNDKFDKNYLWPRTPIHSMQPVIASRCGGASDYQLEIKHSRPFQINAFLQKLTSLKKLSNDFSVLDVGCGDALVLWQIKRQFQSANCHGLDCYAGQLTEHVQVRGEGVHLYRGFLQDLLNEDSPEKFDVVMMLNTYRGWTAPVGKERELCHTMEDWIRRNSRYAILTATKKQITRLEKLGFNVGILGLGEDLSFMICISEETLPKTRMAKHFARVRYRVRSIKFALTLAMGSVRALAVLAKRFVKRCEKMGFRYSVENAFDLLNRISRAVLKKKIAISSVFDHAFRSDFLSSEWPVKSVPNGEVYVFVFLGEFGYELLNWQGAVRKFSELYRESAHVVVASRRGLEPFYESANQYIDISDHALYQKSIAAAYFAIPPELKYRSWPPTREEVNFNKNLKISLTNYLKEKVNHNGKKCHFVFSSELNRFPGVTFGVDWRYYGMTSHPGNIYSKLDLENNIFAKVVPKFQVREELERKLGFSLEEPYVLVQNRHRDIGPQIGNRHLPFESLIEEVSHKMRVVRLEFNTGRYLDSQSSLKGTGAVSYQANSFLEQGCLIKYAHRCIFATEGDLGSHTYLPPLMGKSVHVIASQSIWDQPSAPISFWNSHIFRFGGQMIPWDAEKLFASPNSIRVAVVEILAKQTV